ncbi:hypothetical protein S576_23685 [Salmonella enterica subsp. enterica serovar Give]|nr:hypothetical protein [Salmonella enterica subsp. enterica serovar Give]EED4548156.1 hypothetical protein [Salmonella enterica subsp. enterica serovar Give]
MDLTLLLRIKTFKGSTGSRPLGFFVGERFLALLCVNEKGMYLERHSMQTAFAPFALTPGFEKLPGDIRAVNFYSSLEASQRAELLNVLYTRNYNEGEKVSCSEVNMRIAGTIRDIIDNLPNKYALLTPEENAKILNILEPEYVSWLKTLYGDERLTGDQLDYFVGVLREAIPLAARSD